MNIDKAQNIRRMHVINKFNKNNILASHNYSFTLRH